MSYATLTYFEHDYHLLSFFDVSTDAGHETSSGFTQYPSSSISGEAVGAVFEFETLAACLDTGVLLDSALLGSSLSSLNTQLN